MCSNVGDYGTLTPSLFVMQCVLCSTPCYLSLIERSWIVSACMAYFWTAADRMVESSTMKLHRTAR